MRPVVSPAAALQLGAELAERYAQIGFDQVVFAEPGKVRKLLGYCGFFAGGEFRALDKARRRTRLARTCGLPR